MSKLGLGRKKPLSDSVLAVEAYRLADGEVELQDATAAASEMQAVGLTQKEPRRAHQVITQQSLI